MSDWNTFQTAYQSASAGIKAVLDSEQVAKIVDKLEMQATDTLERKKYMVLVSDLLLDLATKEEVELALKKDLDAVLVPAILHEIEQLKNSAAASMADTTEASTPTATDNQPAGVRTMADDMESAQNGPTHSSSQDDLLKKP